MKVLQALAEEDIAKETPRLGTYYTLHAADAPQDFVRQLLPGLIRAMPIAPSADQMHVFNHALVPAARRHLESSTWHELLSARLDEKGLSQEFFVALHVASIAFDPEWHFIALGTLADIDPDVALLIRKAIEKQGGDWAALAQQRPELVSWLAELLATCAVASGNPFSHESGEPFARGGRTIYNALELLAGVSSQDARTELHRLRELACMEPWQTHLDWSIGKQQKLYRASAFSAPPFHQVATVLANRAPANARDMAVLIIDQLTRLAQHIRFTEANQLDLFWHPDGKGGQKPRTENECRDVLLGLIRPRLQLQGVTIDKEHSAAADKRADLQGTAIVRGELVTVPVEIKKDDHPDVWSAWRDQLEARYMSNPAAGGVGIYMVLWFGHKTKRHTSGIRPLNAEDAAALFTKDIPADRRGHLFGLVIDLSPRSE